MLQIPTRSIISAGIFFIACPNLFAGDSPEVNSATNQNVRVAVEALNLQPTLSLGLQISNSYAGSTFDWPPLVSPAPKTKAKLPKAAMNSKQDSKPETSKASHGESLSPIDITRIVVLSQEPVSLGL